MLCWSHRRKAFALVALLAALPASAQRDPPAWTRPTEPFRLVGPIWYVGTEGLSAYLIKTNAGAILIDPTMAENVRAIERNIVTAGVPLRQVRWILLSHAHFDHAAGMAAMARDTRAKVAVGVRDAEAMRTGTPPGETNYGVIRFPAARVDRALRDQDTIRLSGVTIRAIATPGHTPGCMTYTMQVIERGRRLNVVFPCSVSVAGNKLVGNRRYPGIVDDFRTSFARLAALPADVVLPAHPEGADVAERARAGTLIAPGLLRTIVLRARDGFDRDLAKQKAAR